MKYILYEGEHLPEEMAVFFETANHKEMAIKLGVANKIISAGFMKINIGGFAHCYGHSESLKIDSRGEKDAKVFDRQNRFANIHS